MVLPENMEGFHGGADVGGSASFEEPPALCALVTGATGGIGRELCAQLARECPAKVIAEGHIHTPEQAVQALYAGAFALVVGGAITRPAEITARFTAAINNHK